MKYKTHHTFPCGTLVPWLDGSGCVCHMSCVARVDCGSCRLPVISLMWLPSVLCLVPVAQGQHHVTSRSCEPLQNETCNICSHGMCTAQHSDASNTFHTATCLMCQSVPQITSYVACHCDVSHDVLQELSQSRVTGPCCLTGVTCHRGWLYRRSRVICQKNMTSMIFFKGQFYAQKVRGQVLLQVSDSTKAGHGIVALPVQVVIVIIAAVLSSLSTCDGHFASQHSSSSWLPLLTTPLSTMSSYDIRGHTSR